MPQIEITYDIDANGILNVTAKEKSTGKAASITIQNTTTLDDSEVERMVSEAQNFADADREAREYAEVKNNLDSMRIQAQNALNEAGDVDDSVKQPLQDAVSEADRAINNNDTKERLEELMQSLSEKLAAFQQANQSSADGGSDSGSDSGSDDGGSSDGGQGDDEDVIDADFKPAG
jgi:molecular chaperone DnaK